MNLRSFHVTGTDARAIAADGACLVGWIGNGIDPAMDRCDDVFTLLRERLPVLCRQAAVHRATRSAGAGDASGYACCGDSRKRLLRGAEPGLTARGHCAAVRLN